jgi:hypothetical protein
MSDCLVVNTFKNKSAQMNIKIYNSYTDTDNLCWHKMYDCKYSISGEYVHITKTHKKDVDI